MFVNLVLNFLTYILNLALVLLVIVIIATAALVIDLFYGLAQSLKREDKAQKREHAVQAKDNLREMMRKEAIRRQKEAEAHEGFFEESYIRGFDSNGSLYHLPKVVPTAQALEYYKQMDELENTQQFDVVEEIQRDLSKTEDQ